MYYSPHISFYCGISSIIQLGKAVENYNYSSITSKNRDYLYAYIKHNISDAYLIGADLKYRLPHNLYMCFKGISGEALMTLLDTNGYQVSTGSACNSGNPIPSPALMSIGMNERDIHSCIRITLNGQESKKELDNFCVILKTCVEQLRYFT